MQASSKSLVFRALISSQQYLRPMTRRPRMQIVYASSRDADDRKFEGRIVDENMIVLRMRIHEIKMVESNYEAPAHWMDWEKKCSVSYCSHVCEGVGLLQRFLMSTRPCVGVGMLVLVGLRVPTAIFVVLFNLIEACKWRCLNLLFYQ